MKLLIIATWLTLTQSMEYALTGPPVIKIKNGGIITEDSDHHTNTLIKDKVSSVVKDYIAHKNLVGEVGINAESVKNFLENHAADITDCTTDKIVTSYKFGGGNEIVLSIPKNVAAPKITESTSTHIEKHIKTNSINGKTLNLNSNDIKDSVKHNVKEYLENLRKDAIYADKPTVVGQELLNHLKLELSDDVNTYNLLKENHHESSSEGCTFTGKMKSVTENKAPILKTNVKEFREDILENKMNYNKVIQDKIKILKRPEKLKYSEIENLNKEALRKKLEEADLYIKKNWPKTKKRIIKRIKPLQKNILKNKKIYYNRNIKRLNDIKKAKIALGKKYYKNKVLTKSKPLKCDQLVRKKYKNLNKKFELEKRYAKAKHYMFEMKKNSKTLLEPDKINLKAKLLELKTMKKPRINFDKEKIRVLSKENLLKYYTNLSERPKLMMTDFELSKKLPEMKIKLENFQRNLAEQSKLNILDAKLQQLQNIEKQRIHFKKIAPKYELLIQQGYKTFLPDRPQFGTLHYVPDHLNMAPSVKIPKLKHELPASIHVHKPHNNLVPKYIPFDLSLNSEPLLIDVKIPAKQQFHSSDLKTSKKYAKNKIMKDLKKQKKLQEDYGDALILNESNLLDINKLKHNNLPQLTIYKSEPDSLLDTLEHYADEIVVSDFSESADKLKFLTNDVPINEYDIIKENFKLNDAKDYLNIDLQKQENKPVLMSISDTHQALFDRNDILKEKIHKLKSLQDIQDNPNTDFNRFIYKADKHVQYKVPDGSEILKGKLIKFKGHVEDVKDQLNNNLDRLKYEKTLAVPNGFDILKEEKYKLNDYAKDDSIDIDLDKLKNHAKKLILAKESDILKEKVHKLESNVEETMHHIDKNLERRKFEKKLAISNKINSLQEKKEQLNDYIKEAEEAIDNNLDKVMKTTKEKLVVSEGNDNIKQKIHELENNVEKTKDCIEKDLERLKFEKNIAISNGINILKEKKGKLNDYVKEVEENIDISLDTLKNNAKELASSDGGKIFKEKMQELENNFQETKHHIDENLEKLSYEKNLAISNGHHSLKEKMHKLKDSVKDTSDRINNNLEKLKHDSQMAAISNQNDISKQRKHETEEEQKETHDQSRLSKLKHDVNNLVISNEHALKHKVDHLKSNIKNIHDDSSLTEKSRKGSFHESTVDEGSSSNHKINTELATANQEKIGNGRKKLKQYTITQRRKKNRDKKVPIESQMPSNLESANKETDPSQ